MAERVDLQWPAFFIPFLDDPVQYGGVAVLGRYMNRQVSVLIARVQNFVLEALLACLVPEVVE